MPKFLLSVELDGEWTDVRKTERDLNHSFLKKIFSQKEFQSSFLMKFRKHNLTGVYFFSRVKGDSGWKAVIENRHMWSWLYKHGKIGSKPLSLKAVFETKNRKVLPISENRPYRKKKSGEESREEEYEECEERRVDVKMKSREELEQENRNLRNDLSEAKKRIKTLEMKLRSYEK